MPKVYILQNNPFDPKNFISAEEYGELVYVFNEYVSPNHLNRAYSRLFDKLRDMTKEDWLIPTGNPALIALVGSFVMDKLGSLPILIWDNQNKTYIPTKVNKYGYRGPSN